MGVDDIDEDGAIDALEEMAEGFARDSSPLLERLGLSWFRRRAERAPPIAPEASVHLLDAEERANLRRIERGAIARAGVAGGLSGLAAALAEHLMPAAGEGISTVMWWAVVLGVGAVATVFEIGFLYWDALRSVHRMSRAAGVSLLEATDPMAPPPRKALALALCRAALELPNPPDNPFGIDPFREVSSWRLAAAALVYKLKVTVTNFLLKALLRRALGRVLLRTWLLYVAVPVTALWNAAVTWRVLREVRIRALGPSAGGALLAEIRHLDLLSADGWAVARRAVVSSVVRTADLHPNLVALLGLLGTEDADDEGLDDPARFLKTLAALQVDAQRVVLSLLSFSVIADGALDRGEVALVNEAASVCGMQVAPKVLRGALRDFVQGRALSISGLTAIFRMV